ncbi:MAG: alpha/beta hydrolase [Dactylosporangium sp.]|nr:alpha/beta hydrolase [Dactylosporangium sp.]NNJ61893.1 alpha/beta hydrolase [Dactylosporangium sp.]
MTNIAVAKVPGYRELHMDLHLPRQRKSAPVVFWVHGGGWYAGSRTTVPDSILDAGGVHRILLSRGFAVADVDYRLSREAPWPTQLHDVKAAIRWVRAFASDLGVDPDRFAVLGYSAGAHLAAFTGLTSGSGSTDLEGSVGVTGVSSAVQAAATWYGPTDLLPAARGLGIDLADPDSSFAWLLGCPVTEDALSAASPINHVNAAAPPFLCVHGTADQHVSAAHSEWLAERLRAHGVRCDLHLVPGADHDFVGAPDVKAVIDLTVEFLCEAHHR